MKKVVGPTNEDTQKLLWQEKETCLLSNNCDKVFLSPRQPLAIVATTLPNIARDTKFAQMNLVMTTSANVSMPSTDKTMSTYQQND
jgi:hypothetical protein